MRGLAVPTLLALLLQGCMTIQGHIVRESRSAETRRMGEVLDPLLSALDMPSLRTIATSPGCKIGFAVVRTGKVNVWSTPATESPCLYFSLFVSEGALAAPSDELMAMIAHELGHVMLRHVPQSERQRSVSDEAWRDIQRQELEADRFAVDVLKRMRASSAVASCDAMGRLLRRGGSDWYGDTISPRMDEAVTERANAADAACASAEVTLLPEPTSASLAP